MATEPPVKLGMKAAGFQAQRVTLPHKLVASIPGLDRHYMIHSPDQEVPAALRLYLQNDNRYRNAFESTDAPAPAPAAATPTTTTTSSEPPATPAASETEPPIAGGYSSKWRMFVLRDYAAKNGVTLEATDTTKADVLGKLKAAGLVNDEAAPEPEQASG
jgi:hypothetical protein